MGLINYYQRFSKRYAYELCDEGGKSVGIWHAKDLKADNYGEL
jgi:hypothetical protein